MFSSSAYCQILEVLRRKSDYHAVMKVESCPSAGMSISVPQKAEAVRFIYAVAVVFTARSELRKVLFLALSVTLFCLCMKYLGNRWTGLRQIQQKTCFVPRLDRFEFQGQRSRSPETKTTFSPFSTPCVRFMFGKTSLVYSSFFIFLDIYTPK